MRQRLLPLLLTFYIAKREMLSFQAIQTQGIETEEDSTRRAGKPACFFCTLLPLRNTTYVDVYHAIDDINWCYLAGVSLVTLQISS